MDIYHFLHIFSFEDPEPLATPTAEALGGVVQSVNGILEKLSEAASLPQGIVIAIIAAIILVFLLLVLILILSIAKRARRNVKQTARPVAMARPPVTRPVPGKPSVPANTAVDIPTPTAQTGFGLQFILPGGKVASLNALPATIGRGSGNTVVLDYETVSTIHARVYYDPALQAVCIEDQNSLNGIRVNEKPTHKNILNNGDEITVGDITMVFQDNGYIPS